MPGTVTIPRGKAVARDGPRGKADVSRLLGLAMEIRVVLAERKMPLASILDIHPGTIIEFEVPFDSELVLYAGDRPIGVGQAVKVGENFGLRVTHIGTVSERIQALGS